MSIDTSKMSKEKAAALEIAEAGRDDLKKNFAGGLFTGDTDFSSISPFPTQSQTQKKIGTQFISELQSVFDNYVDSNKIDTEGEIPEEVFEELAKIGAFSIKIPEEYDGRGLSQLNYARGAILTGMKDGNIAALLSAHQSIGVPQPLLMYGTDDQKKKYLPKFAKGTVSAFALTEHNVGSDPAQMETTAVPSSKGDHFIINGEKLWCTNGLKAGVIVVMAKTPDVNGKKQITAFIVDTDTKGVKIKNRCRFMGLKALYNGIIEFNNVEVPAENILLAEGKGMKVALNTLNIGRLTLPAICIGLIKQSLHYCRLWASTRKQWGCEIGKHEAIGKKLSDMAMDIFATEAMVYLTCGLVDSKTNDIRVESAMCKMWGTEQAWRVVDDAMQIFGGRGYETVSSLADRGEAAVPIERNLRDTRINLIFEGSSEIMRLILAREALDMHLKVAGDVLNSKLPMKKRITGALKAGLFYAKWYPKQWLPIYNKLPKGMNRTSKKHLKYVRKTSKKLARALFHSMLKYGPKLDKQQLLLGRLAEIGTELFVITACEARCDQLIKQGRDAKDTLLLVDCIFKRSQSKISNLFREIKNNNDKSNYILNKNILNTNYDYLESVYIT